MIRSSLIAPLVAPLVGRRGNTSAIRSSGFSKSRLCATALAISALIAATAPDEAKAAKQVAANEVVCNAHKKPTRIYVTPVWAVDMLAVLTGRDELATPGEAASFDNDALQAARYRHRLDPGLTQSLGLGRGRRIDRLLRATDLAFLNFGSATVLAAQPHS